ncbi:uncharacterized protein A1O5_01680 [Cladophialophora psammophila CBS 110553]|uniref:BTB domain-containing protein n=1 Tax=Cladophialophora psammophila CBS 110553 TaxID=1182543 RepID=W9XXJ5_9EURO|nr:uncharacterized protein A1O5_01680 [Cladophialophora psammophila CBS 110553]EXJ74984.1 hypothetical protein A1O5_01680 [Cladophialophora psammophila CBS 110553]
MDVAERSSRSSAVADISPDGDVVLIVGPEKIRLRVYSQILRCASRVFSTMFEPCWNTDQDHSKALPREILLPEDDGRAFSIICCVIHHRNDLVPAASTMSAKGILQIAIVTDKYDLHIALKYASGLWLRPEVDFLSLKAAGYFIATAFLFNDADLFAKVALYLTISFKETYLALLDNDLLSQFIPWKVIYILEERRNQMRAEIGQLIIRGMNGRCDCGWGEESSEKYEKLNRKYGPLKMIEVPISHIIEKIKTITSHTQRYYIEQNINQWCENHKPIDANSLDRQLKTLKDKMRICLSCIRTSGTTTLCNLHSAAAAPSAAGGG